MLYNKYILFILLIPISLSSFSQPSQEICKNICSYKTSTPSIFKKLEEALINPAKITEDTKKIQRIIEQILCIEKLSSKDYDTYAFGEYNASIAVCNNRKYIFYNTDFLLNASKYNVFSMYGILAHEIGHHIRGDSWLGNEMDKKSLYEAELSADEYSGKILGRLNLPYEVAVKCLEAADLEASATHPSRKEREVRFKIGWEKGTQLIIPNIEQTYDLNCQTNIVAEYALLVDKKGIRTNLITRKKKVPVFVSPIGNAKIEDIKSIKYYLHPTSFKFNAPEQDNVENNFRLSLTSVYGEFELRATIYLKDGSDYLLVRYLDLWEGDNGK